MARAACGSARGRGGLVRSPLLSPANCASRAAQAVKKKTDVIFKKMDIDGDGEVTPEEAAKFFKSFVRATQADPNAAHAAARNAHTSGLRGCLWGGRAR